MHYDEQLAWDSTVYVGCLYISELHYFASHAFISFYYTYRCIIERKLISLPDSKQTLRCSWSTMSMIGALFNTCTKRPRLENESVLWQRAAHVSILSQPSKESEISTRPPRSVVRYRLSRHDCLLPSSSYLVCLFAFPSITSPLYPTLGNPSYLTVHDRGPFLTPLPAASTPTERTVPASTSSSSSHTCSRYVVRVSVFKHDRAHEKVSRQHSAIVSGGSSDRTQWKCAPRIRADVHKTHLPGAAVAFRCVCWWAKIKSKPHVERARLTPTVPIGTRSVVFERCAMVWY